MDNDNLYSPSHGSSKQNNNVIIIIIIIIILVMTIYTIKSSIKVQ